jgi:two-component system, OmpR family, alkaline phosphatase synthesis response regulator PhoP
MLPIISVKIKYFREFFPDALQAGYLLSSVLMVWLAGMQPERTLPMKTKILIVDDVKLFLEVQQDMLDRTDCDILTARSGLEALKVIKKEKPQLVLMDYNLPDLTGDKACEIIKGDPRFKDIPIMIVSSDHQSEARVNCLSAGADHYLTKPIDREEFIRVVGKLLKVRGSLYYPRALLRTEVYVRYVGDVKKYNSVDISVTGIFLETDDALPSHQTYTIHFTVPIPRRDIQADARITKVVTVKDRDKLGLFPGMAFEFLNLDLEDRKYIEEYVDKSTSIRKRTLGQKDHRISFI